jgi:hypothetical protein
MKKTYIDFLGIESHGKFENIHEPKPPQIEKAIKGLDGDAHTMVILHAIPDAHLMIGGGRSDWCVLSLTIKQKEFYCLLNPAPLANMPPMVRMKVNTQENMYPREMLVPKDMALKVAHPFAEKGELDPSLQWRTEHLTV